MRAWTVWRCAIAFALVERARALEIRVARGETECVTERVGAAGSDVVGSWFVTRAGAPRTHPSYGESAFHDDYGYWDAGGDAFDARATLESGDAVEEVYNALRKTEHRFEYGARNAGTLRTCFTNSGARDASVKYSATIGHRWDHEKATQEHIDPSYEQLNNVEAEVGKLLEEVRYHETRARRAMRTAETVNTRVLRWALLEAVIMVCASLYQFHHVKGLFKARDRQGGFRV